MVFILGNWLFRNYVCRAGDGSQRGELAVLPCQYLAPSMAHSFILFKTAKKNEPRKSRPEIKLIFK